MEPRSSKYSRDDKKKPFNKNARFRDKGDKKLTKFEKADTNGDGKLSPAEFKAAFPGGDTDKRFESADTNKDGFLSPEELKVAHGNKPAKQDK